MSGLAAINELIPCDKEGEWDTYKNLSVYIFLFYLDPLKPRNMTLITPMTLMTPLTPMTFMTVVSFLSTFLRWLISPRL